MDIGNVGKQRRLSLLSSTAAIITLKDTEILARCPMGDRISTVAFAILQIFTFSWQTVAISLLIHMLLDLQEINWVLVGFATLLSSIIALSDTSALLQNAQSAAGLAQLIRGGLDVPQPMSERIQHVVQFIGRMFFGCVYAQLTAIGLTFYIFKGDIDRTLKQDAVNANAAITQTVSDQYDGTTREEASRLEVLKAAQSKAIEDAATLRRTVLQSTVTDPALTIARERVSRLEALVDDLGKRLEEAQRFSAGELDGSRVAAGSSGRAGDGPVRRAAEERRKAAETALARGNADLQAARDRVLELEQAAGRASGDRKALIDQRLREVNGAETGYAEKIAALDAALRTRTAEREEAIRKAVEANPDFIPPARGLLARARALSALMQDRWSMTLVILFDLAFFGIEMGAVLGKVLSSVPSHYARLLAGDDFARDVENAHAVFERVSRLRTPLQAANDPSPSVEQPGGAPHGKAAPAGLSAANDQGSRSASLADQFRMGAEAAQAADVKRDGAKRRGRPPGSKTRPQAGGGSAAA